MATEERGANTRDALVSSVAAIPRFNEVTVKPSRFMLRNCTPFGARHIAVIKAFPSSAEITSAVPFSVLTRN